MRPVLTTRLALVALAGAALITVATALRTGPGADSEIPWVLVWIWAVGLLVVAVVDLLLAADPRALALRRTGDTHVRLGSPARISLMALNTGNRRLGGILRDAWVPSAGVLNPRHPLDIPAGGVQTLLLQLLPIRRGDRRADRITVRSIGPLGLAGRQLPHVVPWTLRVHPTFASRRHLPSKLARLEELDGLTSLLVRGQGTEFDSLREYVLGDDVRSIDWRASARASDVMVRTWQPERDRHVVMVLDTGRTSAARIGDATRLDAGMDACLLLAALASRAGDRVELLAFDRRPRARVRDVRGDALIPTMSDVFAGIEPEFLELDARGLVTTVLASTRRRSLVVLITALDPAPLAEGLLPVLGSLTARHTVVLASVADSEPVEMAAGRGDAEAVYAAAAASAALGERDRMHDLLVRLGIVVVDSPPELLAPALADTYLALKAAGRL